MGDFSYGKEHLCSGLQLLHCNSIDFLYLQKAEDQIKDTALVS